ncbi:plastid division protein PDV1-like [Curcuma longa]|uniref:plastid division protein PDV1-like n=1 Tax=Curcuma longa TaxID=136217 RepID=UPI003D9F337E
MATEVVLERIWVLHDKVSDAIHDISRANFFRSVNGLRGLAAPPEEGGEEETGEGKRGFVLVKDFMSKDCGAGMAEVRSLGAIRSALEKVEGQLEFFNMIHSQQEAEHSAAIAILEESRRILAMRLTDHLEKYKFIQDATTFFNNVDDMGHFFAPDVSSENEMTRSQEVSNSKAQEGRIVCTLLQKFISSAAVATKSFRLTRIDGALGSAAMFAVSMLAFLQLNQFVVKGEAGQTRAQTFYRKKTCEQFMHFDVWSARG